MKSSKLGYTQCWFDIGIITEDIVQQQILQFPANPYAEHWRIAALKDHLSKKEAISPIEFEQLLDCTQGDLPVLREVFMQLLDSTKFDLTDQLFSKILDQFNACFGTFATKESKVFIAKRAILKGTYTLANIEEWVAYGKRSLQELILANNKSNQAVLLLLAESGNKRIANQAKALL